MVPSFALAALLFSSPIASVASVGSVAGPPLPAASELSKPYPATNVGAVTGVVVADVALSAAMTTALCTLAPNDAGLDVIHTLRSGGALPFVVGASLVTVGASGVGAAAGHVAAGGEVAGSTAAVAGAMAGAVAGTLVASAPGLLMLGGADQLAQREPQSFGDAIAIGLTQGVYEAFGLLWVAATPLLVAPVAGGGAFVGGSLAGVE